MPSLHIKRVLKLSLKTRDMSRVHFLSFCETAMSSGTRIEGHCRQSETYLRISIYDYYYYLIELQMGFYPEVEVLQ
jgi:hypothetical protein